MENVKIVFTAPWQVEVQRERLTAPELSANQVWLKKRYTLISAGTELACLSGGESWFSMPSVPGYAAVSEIVETGPQAEGFKAGDIVFHYGNHSLYEVTTTGGVFLKVPAGLELSWVPFTRMATVAMTSIRASRIELGDMVAVTGLGLVGNMASQLAGLQGAAVIGVDLSARRLDIAKQCGLRYALPGGSDVRENIAEITQGHGVSTLIEATGVPQVAVEAVSWVAKYGEVILLGSPRGTYLTDVTDLLNYVHLDGRGCITFKGAHEWRYPVAPDPFVKHSLVRNSEIVFRLMLENRLHIQPLISHVLAPDEAPAAYEGLRGKKDEYHGVLFNWQ